MGATRVLGHTITVTAKKCPYQSEFVNYTKDGALDTANCRFKADTRYAISGPGAKSLLGAIRYMDLRGISVTADGFTIHASELYPTLPESRRVIAQPVLNALRTAFETATARNTERGN